MRILHLEHDQYPKEALEKLARNAIVVPFECHSQDELIAFLKHQEFDVIFTRLGLMINKEVMLLQQNLTHIVTATTGLNHIDIDTAAERNISVISLKGESDFLATIKSTAEHTWALLLALTRNLVNAHSAVIDHGSWERKPYEAGEVSGKAIGIIGYGRLGKIVAQYAKAFGMHVLFFDNDPTKQVPDANSTPAELNTLLQKSDYIVLLISWSPENIDFFDASKFALMKPGAYFINTSRGELVNEEALLENLTTHHLKGAALDVLNNDSSWEKKVKGSFDLLRYAGSESNLIITPHMGGYGTDSIARTRNFITNIFLNSIKTIN